MPTGRSNFCDTITRAFKRRSSVPSWAAFPVLAYVIQAPIIVHCISNHVNSSGWVISRTQRPLPNNKQHSQETAMPPVRFEPALPTSEQSHTHVSDRAATGKKSNHVNSFQNCFILQIFQLNVCFVIVTAYPPLVYLSSVCDAMYRKTLAVHT